MGEAGPDYQEDSASRVNTVLFQARSCSLACLSWGVQVTMCDQLTHYLNKFVAAAAPTAAAGPAAGEVATIDGYKVRCPIPAVPVCRLQLCQVYGHALSVPEELGEGEPVYTMHGACVLGK